MKLAQLIRVPIDQLVDNDCQPRKKPSEAMLVRLADDIFRRGLLQPIGVREKPPGYQIIFGHTRRDAFRFLVETMPTEEEKAPFRTIPAVLFSDVSDAEMPSSAYAENVLRENFTPVEEAEELDWVREREGRELTASDLSEIVASPSDRIQALIRLHAAPEFIKHACQTGIIREEEDPEGQGKQRFQRRLELFPALEFIRIYEHFLAGRTPTEAEEKTQKLLTLALERELGIRQIRKLREKELRESTESIEQKPATKGKKQIYRWSKGCFVVDASRLTELSSDQKASLAEHLGRLLNALNTGQNLVAPTRGGQSAVKSGVATPKESPIVSAGSAPEDLAHVTLRSTASEISTSARTPPSTATARPPGEATPQTRAQPDVYKVIEGVGDAVEALVKGAQSPEVKSAFHDITKTVVGAIDRDVAKGAAPILRGALKSLFGKEPENTDTSPAPQDSDPKNRKAI